MRFLCMTLVFSGIIKVAVGVADNTYRDFDCSGYHKNLIE